MLASKLPFDFSVATATKDRLVTSIACLNCPIMYRYVSSFVNLIRLPTSGLEVNLGVDLLSSNHVFINCSDN